MRLTKKRGVIVLASVAVVAMAVAIPTVIAGSLAAGSGGVPATASAPAPAAVYSASGWTSNRMAYASNNATSFSTASTSFVQVPGMSVGFDVPLKDTAVEIEFSAFAFAAGGGLSYVDATIDGSACQPGEVQFSGDDDENTNGEWARSHSYTFICTFVLHDPLHPHHTAAVNFRSYSGSTVFLHKPTMVIHWGA